MADDNPWDLLLNGVGGGAAGGGYSYPTTGGLSFIGVALHEVRNAVLKDEGLKEERSQHPIGRRYNYNSRKKAKEAAKKAGGGKKPVHHPKGCHGNKRPHYHPNVKNNYRNTPNGVSSHDHYYYPG